ncbi:MAG: ABC transporter permease [Chloroflexi bacterium]|nr:ABC transporter permease [Chloroflexota bacterium]
MRSSLRRLAQNRMAVLGLILIILFLLVALFADFIAPHDYAKQTLTAANSAPLWVTRVFPSMVPVGEERGFVKVNEDYPLGADHLGRDILSRLIYGSRVSLLVAIVGPIVALSVGLTLGLISGYVGGRVDNVIMRLTDIMYAFPTLLFIILLMAFFRPSTGQLEPGTFAYSLNRFDASTGGMFFIFVGIGITSWTQMARLTRGQVLSVREQEYVVAARALGVKDRAIMLRHVLPNILGPIIVAETLTIPAYVSTEAFLSFIGLGVNPPTPSWGSMISEGSAVISTYPSQAVFPAVFLFFFIFAFNFLGDGLRDALDPRMRGSEK